MVNCVAVIVLVWSALVSTVVAQTGDRVWLQIEAQPDEPGASDRARACAALFPDVAGYRLNTNWYAIVLGPYTVAEGAGRLATLLGENMILADGYIVDGSNFRDPFWPIDGVAPAPAVTKAPPFVHFRDKADTGVKVILISQPGDQASLAGLCELLQSLKVVPLTGERSRSERSFSIVGTSSTVQSTVYAELKSGLIKGYTLITKPGQAERDARILAAMQSSFAFTGDTALDPGMVVMADETRKGLLSGLEVRKPAFSRSGFFIDASGSVLTTAEAVANCSRIALERDKDATLRLTDAGLGIAVLTPQTPLAPPAVAAFQSGTDRIGSEIAVSGYSYEDRLTAPVLTFGTLEDTKGLKGEASVKRLALTPEPGDAGGPIVDGTGAVLGMLLPRATEPGQLLPDDVAYAASNAAILARLAKDGILLQTAPTQVALAPENLARQARDMTVLVSCWE